MITRAYRSRVIRFAVILVVLICGVYQVVDGSYRCTEFGVGILGLKKSSPVTIFKKPDPLSDTVAIWVDDTVRAITIDTSFVSYRVMLEYGYEIVGFPVLDFGDDSTWVKVTYNCQDSLGRSEGWIRVDQDVHVVKTWTEILVNNRLFFLHKEDIRFFPSPESALTVELFETVGGRQKRLAYIMYPQRVAGSWMEVIVETPPIYFGGENELKRWYGIGKPKRFRAWIRFLDDRKRPRVFYHTRGC